MWNWCSRPEHILQNCLTHTPERTRLWPSGADFQDKLWGSKEELRTTAQFIKNIHLQIWHDHTSICTQKKKKKKKKKNIALHNMLCLMPGPRLAYNVLPFRFIPLHFLQNLSKQRVRNGQFSTSYEWLSFRTCLILYLCFSADKSIACPQQQIDFSIPSAINRTFVFPRKIKANEFPQHLANFAIPNISLFLCFPVEKTNQPTGRLGLLSGWQYQIGQWFNSSLRNNAALAVIITSATKNQRIKS